MATNDQGQIIDLYIPRKCSATNRIITPTDHAAVQINIAKLGPDGVYNGEYETVAFSGFIRKLAQADQHMNRIAAERGLIQDMTKFVTVDKVPVE